MLKEEKPKKISRSTNEEQSLKRVRGRSCSPVDRRQCRSCLYHQNWGDEISRHVAVAVRRALILEIRRMLTTMRETRRESSGSPEWPRHVVTTWRCEEAPGGSWSARVCRNLLGMGRSQSCKQHQCSKMKERLDKHHMNCQAVSKAPITKPLREKSVNKMDRASSTTAKPSVRISTSRRNSPLKRNSKIQTAQTVLSFTDNHNLERDKQISEIDKEKHCLQGGIRIKASETREILPKRNVYSERLNSEIQEFFYDIPVFPNTSEMVKQKRLYIISDFVDKIADLFVYINNEDYYVKVRNEIDRCLRNLPMWEPESERDKEGFKNCVGDSLFKFIQTFNEQWYSFRKKTQSAGKFPNSFVAYNNHLNHVLQNVITDWVECNLKPDSNTDIVVDTLKNKIQPILESGTKHVPKEELLNIFEELSPYLHLPTKKTMQLNRFASDLANVLSTMEDKEYKEDFCDDCHYKKKIEYEDEEYYWMDEFEDDTVNQITDILFGNIDLVLHENNLDVLKDVRSVLKSTGEFSDSEAANLAKTLVTNVKDCFNEDFYAKMGKTNHSNSFLILTSEQELSQNSGPKFHSTPKRKKEIPTLNKAEKLYTEKVSAIVRTWLDTTDVNFESDEGQIFKETVVTDLTNDLRNMVKQTTQFGAKCDENILKSVIMKSIRKFELFSTPVTKDSPQVVDLCEHLMALDTNLLNTSFLEPQYGNRQAMANTKFATMNDIRNKRDLYQPKALDILEDNISVWMNEQPSDIFEVSDKATRNQLLQEIATNVQDKLADKKAEEELKNEILQWLNKIVKPQMRRNVDGLAENLKDKIINLPQDETLSRAYHKRINRGSSVKHIEPKNSCQNTEFDAKLNEFVENFIRRSYNIDDDVVKGVLKIVLKQELLKISPKIREDLYEKFTSDEFNIEKFQMELEIVVEVYDWLKRIFFYFPLLKSRSETIDFVHGLARNITEIERERVNYPNRMDYNSWLHTEIAVYLLQKEKEMNDKDLPKIDYHANELCLRIFNLRKNCSEGELNKIIAEHMKKYDGVLAKDYLKKILWHRRLGENVMKMLLENPAASRTNVENKLASVPVPRDESVLKFKMEIKYNITIQDWLHTLPLIPPKDNEEALTRKNMVQELLQEIIKTDERKVDNSRDNQADEDLDQYIIDWISRLNLDPTVDVDEQMLVSQLRFGIEFIKWSEKQPQPTSNPNLQGEINRTQHSRAHNHKSKDHGEQIVETIESWCNNLPIEAETVEATTAIKDNVATNMFQVVGSLSGDPRVASDKQKFRDMLATEIEAQLQILSEYDAVTANKEILKAELLEKIIEIENMIRDVNAGDDYVQSLENTIDKSLSKPHRGSSIKTNPGYELFKKRMVMLWILQNYDYAVDYHSLKYKKMLSDEINLLSEEAQEADVFPADKEEIINDLVSVFYKAQPPNEDAIVYEIEYIKLRCEIESWAKELPLRVTLGYNKLLERDQILTILSKILLDIERNEEAHADEKMHTEIMKWSKKLPLLPEEKDNLPKYADLLVCLLKASANSRKSQRQPESKNLTVVQETLKKLKSSDEDCVPKTNQQNTSQAAGPSAPRACSHECGATREKLTYLITKAIDNWSNQLPLQFNSPNDQNIAQKTKEQIIQRIMHLVSELHYRPNTLNNEGLYEYYLNNEIENILIELTKDRLYWEAQFERNERKYQLINDLKAIRPLVQVEKEREGYKNKLKHTISSFHESMVPQSAVQLSNDSQMAILDDFMQYKNHKGDFEHQELYKLKIKETLNNELNDQEINVDPLLATNRLICEMSKVKYTTQSNGTQRRFSQPNPIGNTSRLQSVPPPRRYSLPYPLPQHSCSQLVPSQHFLHQQSLMTFHDPVPQPQAYAMPFPVARPIYQRPSDFQQGPVPDPKAISLRTNDTQSSMPFPSSRPVSQIPLEMQQGSVLFPSPRIISHPPSPSDLQHEPIDYPYPQRTVMPQTNLEIRPFPIPHPEYNNTNTNYLSPRSQPFIQGPQITDAQPDFDIAQSYKELGEPQNVEQQNLYRNVRPETGNPEIRTTGRIHNSPRSLGECPEEQRRMNRQGQERWSDRERRRSRRDYCETCDRDRDCAYIIPRPYPMPMDYMYC